MEQACILHQQEAVIGTGPLLFGGFTFDSQKEKTRLWEEFANAWFVLPTFMLTSKDTKQYMTANIFVTPHTDAEEVYEAYKRSERELFHDIHMTWEEPAIVGEEEVYPVEWMNLVQEAVDTMKQSDIEKIVLARELKLTFDENIDSFYVLKNLHEQQTSSYLFSFDTSTSCFIGATPERLIRKEGNQLTSMCLAGTIGRSETEIEDTKNYHELLNDAKNIREHKIVVQMIRGVMEEVCDTVNIPAEPTILAVRNLYHLYTPVCANTNEAIHFVDIVEKLHPTPALGGYPKEEALSFIREKEMLDRGWYAAPIGWMDGQQNGEFAVAIRSGLVKGKDVSLFAGCGIVEESTPVAEYEETRIKFKPMLAALGGTK
nr:isochorismate synthase [Priestia taiwanensis]